jgi:hypothetical protein
VVVSQGPYGINPFLRVNFDAGFVVWVRLVGIGQHEVKLVLWVLFMNDEVDFFNSGIVLKVVVSQGFSAPTFYYYLKFLRRQTPKICLSSSARRTRSLDRGGLRLCSRFPLDLLGDLGNR